MSLTAEHVRVTLKVHGAEGAWVADVTFDNPGPEAAPLYIPNLFVTGKVVNNVFVITAAGQKVPYTGTYYKRSTPTAEDFVILKPGAQVSYSAGVSAVYAIPKAPGQRHIVYEAFHGDVGLYGDIWELRSNEVVF